jgi:release factor glutamine methyltransferase
MLFLEIGYDQAEQVGALMKDAGYYEVRTIKDYGGNDRIVCGIKSIHQE